METTASNTGYPNAQGGEPGHSFDHLAQLSWNELPIFMAIPTAEDGLDDTARKLYTLADAVANGRSLALSANDSESPLPTRQTAESFAKERMLPREKEDYEMWKAGIIVLPHFDWDSNQSPLPPNSEKTFDQRAVAMNIIWGRQDATPENAVWLTNNLSTLLPLVKAINKLQSAETHLQKFDPLAKHSEAEITEIQTLQLISATVDANVAREKERLHRLFDSINQSQVTLRERLRSLGK
jgi:hypothetical protein